MNVTAWLDVAIGLGIVYLGASLFVTIISEYFSQTFNLRGKTLWDSLDKLIVDPDLRQRLAGNPAFQPFFASNRDRKRAPSYVDPVILARALLGSTAALPPQLKEVIGAVGKRTGQMVTAVSHWIDGSLTMLGEQYKRWLRWISFVIGLCVAVAMNIDTVALTTRLYQDKEMRDAAVAVALDVTGKTDKVTFERCMRLTQQQRYADAACAPLDGLVDAVRGRNASLGRLPIGWAAVSSPEAETPPTFWRSTWKWLVRGAGWLLTALALSLGAPFWFDILGKLVNIRHGMRRPEISSESIPEAGEAEAPAKNQPALPAQK